MLSRRNVLMGVVASAAGIALVRCGADASSHAAQVARSPQPSDRRRHRSGPSCLPPPPAAGADAASRRWRAQRPARARRDLLSLTLDDGVDTAVVRAYCQLAKDTGIRLTMFVTGVFSSWTDNRDLLLPLVESGQIQLGNHTWIHPDLTKLTGSRIADELRHTDQFLTGHLRRGRHALLPAAVRRLQRSGPVGGRRPRLHRDRAVGRQHRRRPDPGAAGHRRQRRQVLHAAESIVIGHLNHPPVTSVYHELVDIIHDRNLRTVTLNDVFLKPEASRLTSAYPG